MISRTYSLSTQIAEIAAKRPDVVTLLLCCPLFSELEVCDLEELAQVFRCVAMAEGDWVFLEGAEATNLYLIVEGRVDVFKESEFGRPIRIASNRAGWVFGEMALLDKAPRSVSVRCAEGGRLLMLSHNAFGELLGRGSPAATRLLWQLAKQRSQRMAEGTSRAA